MSLTTTYRTQIVIPKPQLAREAGNIQGSPCLEILNLAVEKVVAERGGARAPGYSDCNGVVHPCVHAITTPTLPGGVGVLVEESGHVLFEHDRQRGGSGEAQEIAADIARAYAVIATLRLQSLMGYTVRVERETPMGRGRAVATVATRG